MCQNIDRNIDSTTYPPVDNRRRGRRVVPFLFVRLLVLVQVLARGRRALSNE